MKRLWTWLLVIPALGLLGTSEANAQRFGGLSVGVPGFGYSTGMGRGSGFGYGTPGLGYGNSFGYGVNGWNRGYGGYGNSPFGYGGYGGYNPYGYGYGGSGLSISLGNNYNRGYGYGNYGYNSGYYSPNYSTSGYTTSGYSQPTYTNSGYGSPSYSTASVPTMSGDFSQPTYSTSGFTQMNYTTPAYSNESGVIQAGAWSSPSGYQGIMTLGGTIASTASGPAKVKLTVPDNSEVWIDGKQAEGSGTSREFTSDASTGSVKLKIKSGEQTREFTMPVRPGENSTVDITPLLR